MTKRDLNYYLTDENLHLNINVAIDNNKIFSLLEKIAKQFNVKYDIELLDQIFIKYNSRLVIDKSKYLAKYKLLEGFYTQIKKMRDEE